MTLLEIKTTAAAYLGRPLVDLTVGSADLGLTALNQARRFAEMKYDFEFQRKLVTVSVAAVTGGSLDDAVLYGTSTVCEIKTVVDVGLFDDAGNLCSTEWTTVEEGLERQRRSANAVVPRYPRDSQLSGSPQGLPYFTLSGSTIYRWPKVTGEAAITVGLEVYSMLADWTNLTDSVAVTGATGVTGVNTTYYRNGTYNGKALWMNVTATSIPAVVYAIWWSGTAWNITTGSSIGTVGSNYHSLLSTAEFPDGTYTGHGTFTGTAAAVTTVAGGSSAPWTTKGEQFLLWQTIIQLNKLFKSFVPRTEGNLGEPNDLAQAGLDSLIEWDVSRFERHRRHGR